MASTLTAHGAPSTAPHPSADHRPALTALTSLFFMWGFLTCLNDILIPHLKAAFSLNYTQSMLVQFVFFAAYFLVSIPAGRLVKAVSYKRGIVLGLVGAGLGCVLFYPAASLRSYPLFLGAFFVLASGITVLQVAANPYVAILGPPQTASARLNLTQAFNSLGTTVAPLLGATLILSHAVKTPEALQSMSDAEVAAYRAAEASAVQLPYLGLAVVLFVIAAVMATLRLPEVNHDDPASPITHGARAAHDSAWAYRHLVLGAVAIFLYVGAEVSIGSFLVNYLGESDIAGLSEATAGKYLTFYWGGAMVGRFLGAAVLRTIPAGRVLAFNGAIATILVVATVLTDGSVAMWTILGVGLFNSIMFPTIFTLALKGLGKHTSQGSGILCAAIVGGAIVPALQGVLADSVGIQLSFLLPAACYVFIAYYGSRGSEPAVA